MIRLIAFLVLFGSLARAQEPTYAPRKLETSLRARADKAIGSGKLKEAIELYTGWLRADPRDSDAWYNLACCHALQGDSTSALDAFETSVDAGWSHRGHATQDGDLATLRTEPRFIAALKRIKTGPAGPAPQGFKRHDLNATTIGSYVVMLPPDYDKTKRLYPVCVILHGSGSSELRHGVLADRFGRADVIFVAPRALHPHIGVTTRSGNAGWTVWPPDPVVEKGTDAMTQHAAWVMRCVADARKRYRAAPGGVFVWGHSQGAASANCVAALYPDKIAAYCAYAGYYPNEIITDDALAGLAKSGVKVLLLHGMKDTVVSHKGTKDVEVRMRKAGVAVTVSLFECAHGVAPEVTTASIAWLDKVVRPK